MCDKTEAFVSFIIASSLTAEKKTTFPQHLSETLLIEVVQIVLDKFTNKSFGIQEELRNAANKVKWYQRRKLNKYI